MSKVVYGTPITKWHLLYGIAQRYLPADMGERFMP